MAASHPRCGDCPYNPNGYCHLEPAKPVVVNGVIEWHRPPITKKDESKYCSHHPGITYYLEAVRRENDRERQARMAKEAAEEANNNES